MADTPHLIRKYSSRRLYDVAASRFVTLAELGAIIRRGENVRVIDGRKHDVTRSVLLQILTEYEERGEPLLSSDMLHEIVRLYGNAMRVPFGRYLEGGLGLLRKQRKAFNEALPRAFHDVGLATMNHVVEQQAALLKQSREALLSLLGPAPADVPEAGRDGGGDDAW